MVRHLRGRSKTASVSEIPTHVRMSVSEIPTHVRMSVSEIPTHVGGLVTAACRIIHETNRFSLLFGFVWRDRQVLDLHFPGGHA